MYRNDVLEEKPNMCYVLDGTEIVRFSCINSIFNI